MPIKVKNTHCLFSVVLRGIANIAVFRRIETISPSHVSRVSTMIYSGWNLFGQNTEMLSGVHWKLKKLL